MCMLRVNPLLDPPRMRVLPHWSSKDNSLDHTNKGNKCLTGYVLICYIVSMTLILYDITHV